MSVCRVGELRRGRPSKSSKLIAQLYREGKCRECSVSVTRMDFAKILGKFTKVKIQYESAPRDERILKKITSPVTNARLRSNENGMVLIHRSAYKEHPAKQALGGARKVIHNDETPRRRGRPPKNKNFVAGSPNTLTTMQYRIVFYDRRESQDSNGSAVPEEISFVDLLPSLSLDVLPTDEWLFDYLPHDEPKKDHVYDRIAAELEDLMYDAKPEAKTGEKGDDFPSIMDLLGDTLVEPERSDVTDKAAVSASGGDVEAILRGDTDTAADASSTHVESKDTNNTSDSKDANNASDSKESDEKIFNTEAQTKSETKTEKPESSSPKKGNDDDGKSSDSTEKESATQSTSVVEENQHKDTSNDDLTVSLANDTEMSKEDKTESPEKMEVDSAQPTEPEVSKDEIVNEKDSHDPQHEAPMDVEEASGVESGSVMLSEDTKSNNTEAFSKMNGKCPILTDQNINIETINYIIFKRVSNDECNRLVKCSKNLNYSIEMEGKPVELLGAPKYISCVEDLRLMLQIVHESDLNSFNVVHGG